MYSNKHGTMEQNEEHLETNILLYHARKTEQYAMRYDAMNRATYCENIWDLENFEGGKQPRSRSDARRSCGRRRETATREARRERRASGPDRPDPARGSTGAGTGAHGDEARGSGSPARAGGRRSRAARGRRPGGGAMGSAGPTRARGPVAEGGGGAPRGGLRLDGRGGGFRPAPGGRVRCAEGAGLGFLPGF